MNYLMIFCFSIKIEGITVPAHFLHNGGCDVTQMSFSGGGVVDREASMLQKNRQNEGTNERF